MLGTSWLSIRFHKTTCNMYKKNNKLPDSEIEEGDEKGKEEAVLTDELMLDTVETEDSEIDRRFDAP